MDIAAFFQNEWKVIAQAPATFFVAALIFGFVGYWIGRWYYSGQIENLHGRLALRDERAAEEARITMEREARVPVAGESPQTQQPPQPSSSDLIILMDRAARNVGYAVASGRPAGHDQVLSSLNATLLSMRKFYEISIPNLASPVTQRRALEGGSLYLDEIGPLLRQGHLDEARSKADERAPIIDAWVSGERARP